MAESKTKMIVPIGWSQKIFELDPNSKYSSERVQKVPKGPNCGQIENKKMGLYFHTIIDASQVFFNSAF